MSSKVATRGGDSTRLVRLAFCFVFQAQDCDMGLSRTCVERNDNVPLETLVEHFYLILSRFHVVCHGVGIVVHVHC